MRGNWMIDERGDVWPENDPRLGQALGTRQCGQSLTSFLVTQMGFVLIKEHPTRTEVVFNREAVSAVALTAYFYWAADRTFQTTVCLDVAQDGVAKMFHKALALYNHLGSVIEARTPRLDFIQSSIEIEQSTFKSQWQVAVEVCAAPIEASLKLNIIEDLFRGHFVLAERGTNGDYVMRQAGQTLHGFDIDFMRALEGRSFRDAEDRSYGNWIADHYKDIRGTDAPITESVNALIAFRNQGRKRFFYERLIVPMSAPSGADALLIAVNRN